jgi:hypothetical protein
MTIIWIPVGLAAAFLIAMMLWHWGKQPHVHRNLGSSDVQRLLRTLLRRGYDRGSLTLEIEDGSRPRKFLQFSKYIAPGGRTGLQFDFPLASWSEAYYPALRDRLDEDVIRYRIERTGRRDTREFINIDFEHDVEKARDVAMLGLSVLAPGHSAEQVRGYFSGVSAADMGINS